MHIGTGFGHFIMITHVALKEEDGTVHSLPSPARHGSLVSLARVLRNSEFGFLKDGVAFLTREEAWHEAFACNQLLPPHNPNDTSQRAGPVNTTPGPLFSEDVW